MSIRKTLATSARVLRQLRHDPRTIAMVVGIPVLLIVLMKYVFEAEPKLFNGLAPVLLGIFPLLLMFLITSIATLRERTSGTLDRLMTQPIAKLDLIFGYAFAFTIVGLLQASVTTLIAITFLGITTQGSAWLLLLAGVAAAFLGTSLGLLVSAFARNEFQAVQLVMPIIMPQVLLCGLFTPRDHMAPFLRWVSDVLPLTYSVDAMKQVAAHSGWTGDLTRDLLVVFGGGLVALVLGSVTIRRQE